MTVAAVTQIAVAISIGGSPCGVYSRHAARMNQQPADGRLWGEKRDAPEDTGRRPVRTRDPGRYP